MQIALYIVGIVVFIGHLLIVVDAWQKGILWGLGCLLVPLVGLFYVLLNWKAVKDAFLLQLAGWIILAVAKSVSR